MGESDQAADNSLILHHPLALHNSKPMRLGKNKVGSITTAVTFEGGFNGTADSTADVGVQMTSDRLIAGPRLPVQRADDGGESCLASTSKKV